ncbi:MAG: protein kinase domain-containing protein [Gammaproteobacteria bacterium]
MATLSKGQRLLDRFVLIDSLGSGGQGEVWRVLDETRSVQIALKISKTSSLLGLRTQYALAHQGAGKGVLEYFEPIADAHYAVLPMELVSADARSLRAKSWTQILGVLREVAEALAGLHDRGIVHRDLKPSNILIGFDGRARLADFGIAARIGESSSSVVGSPFSASPQQLAGKPASEADDLFGFGALAYELLGGYPPNFPDSERAFAGLPPPQLVTSVATPAGLIDLVMQFLNGDPESRPKNLRAVASMLGSFESKRLTPVVAAKVIRPEDIKAEQIGTSSDRKPSIGAWIGLATLVIALVAVFLILPAFVTPPAKPTIVANPSSPTTSTRPAAQTDPDVIARFEGEDAKFRTLLEELETQGAGVWGGAAFAAAKSLGALALEAEAVRDYALALDRIGVANQRLARIADERPQILAQQLREGDAALGLGRLEVARQAYQLAQRIDPTSEDAGKGLARVVALGPVLPALVEAETASLTLDHLRALTRYEEVLRADPMNRVARDGIARAKAAIGSDRYAREIGDALIALRAGRNQEARAALTRASTLRPGAAEIAQILAQIEAAGERRDLDLVRAELLALEKAENWSAALLRYDALLVRDATLKFARDGRVRVAPRAELSRRVEALLSSPSRLSAPEVRREAERLLSQAAAVIDDAPVLRGQSDRLREGLRLYEKPVLAILESDGLTLVSVQRIGNFGVFTRRELSLKPGRYVAIGSRAGYRDVRQEFIVTPTSTNIVISIRCTETIS